MLVLSRKKNDIVQIGDDIRVVVVEVRGETVRLGFEAPLNVPITRPDMKCKERKKPERFCTF